MAHVMQRSLDSITCPRFNHSNLLREFLRAGLKLRNEHCQEIRERSDPQIATRNWQFVMEEMVKLKKSETRRRWQSAIKAKALDTIKPGTKVKRSLAPRRAGGIPAAKAR